MKDQKTAAREPLALVGMACRFPEADNTSEYWSNILNGVDCITDVPASHWRPEDYFDADPKRPDMTYAKRGGFLKPVPFQPLDFGIPPTSIEATDTSQLLGMMVARDALVDAGYGPDRDFDRDRVGVMLGVTGALELVIPLGARLGHPIWRRVLREAGLDEARTEEIVQKIADGYVPWQEQSFPGLLGNVVAGRIANALNLGGTNCVVDAACASALSAVHLAAMELWTNRADMVITGGVDTFNDIFMYMCFSKTPALSPSGNARPFDAQGDGTILGEGVGMVVLKRLADAERDGDRIYAVLKGMGSSSDGKGNAIYAPSAKGQAKALRRAYDDADVSPESIQMVECHGTGTKVGDAVELSALTDVYRASKADGTWCAVGSVKSQIGHTKAAAGAAGLMKAALALHHKVLPPSIKVQDPLAGLKDDTPFYLGAQARPWLPVHEQRRRAAVSAFGFGGSNFHAVIEEYQPQKPTVTWDGMVEILAFSAKDRTGLNELLASWTAPTEWSAVQRACAVSRKSFSINDNCRLLLVLEKEKAAAKTIERARTLLKTHAETDSWSAPEGIVFGSGARQGKLGFLFPGQGAQYPNMLRDLACRFPEMQGVLADVDKAFADSGEVARLTDLIYPHPTYDEKTESRNHARLRHTQYAQPAIGAVSIGALKILNGFGIAPEAVAGHSYGEITALCASERFDTEALCLLSKLRGKLMAEGEGDRGAMLAVRAPLDRVETIVSEHELDVVLANKNAPDQVVLSGFTSEIERAASILDELQVSNKQLSVAAAFHSTLVAKAREPFFAELKKIDFPEAKVPVYSNTTALPYPERPEEARHLLATQLTKPVEFVEEINNMYADGVRTFLEVGPGARLTGLVKSILKDRKFDALSVDASSGSRGGMVDMARMLARLAALGVPFDLMRWEDGETRLAQPEPKKKGLVISISGANYVSDKTRQRAAKPLPKPVQSHVEAPGKAMTAADAPAQGRKTSAPETPAQGRKTSAPETPTAKTDRPKQSTPQPKVADTSPSQSASVMLSGDALSSALQSTSESLAALQRFQSETADLHRRFLEGQEQAQRNLKSLIDQQRDMISGKPLTNTSKPMAAANAPFRKPAAGTPAAGTPAAETPASDKPQQAAATPQPIAATQRNKVKSEAPAQAPQASDQVEAALLKVVSEKTGYPEDMLELDMQLDGDLGIDSIKRVEILSSLQEALPSLSPIAPDAMGRIERLRDIVTMLAEHVAAPTVVDDAASEPVPNTGQADVATALLGVVAEKTGYPTDMLSMDMSLDGDLGIDSIKRVEILSGLRDRLPHTPEIAPDDLGRFHTLADITDYLAQMPVAAVAAPASGEPASGEPASGEPASGKPASGKPASGKPVGAENLQAGLLDVVAEKTGYPADMLAMDMSLDADLGIDSIKRVEILSALQDAMPNLPEVKPDRMGELRTLQDIVAVFGDAHPAQPAASPSPTAFHPAGGVSRDAVFAALRALVAEKTGYPEDMLEAGMHLDGDLGIDSIKRVEIFSALQEALPELPEVKPDELGNFNTLGEIADHFGAANVGSETGPAGEPVSHSVPTVDLTSLRNTLLDIVAEKTGYPADMLEDNMALEGDLGIDSIKRVEILSALQEAASDLPEIQADRMGGLQTLGDILQFFAEVGDSNSAKSKSAAADPTVVTEAVEPETVARWVVSLADSKLGEPYKLTQSAPLWVVTGEPLSATWQKALKGLHPEVAIFALNDVPAAPPSLAGLVLMAPATDLPAFLEAALLTAGRCADALESAAKQGGALFATVTQMGGYFGFESLHNDPQQGALAGLAKTADREWPAVHCRALDLAVEMGGESWVAGLFAAGPVEIGMHTDRIVHVQLTETEPLPTVETGAVLSAGDVVLVTGGARGVTAETAIALAQVYAPTLVLLGRSAFPAETEPAWVADLQDEAAIKRALMAHAETPLKPKQLQERYDRLMADREMRRNKQRMEQAGATVVYRSLDTRSQDAVQSLVAELRDQYGQIAGLVHGAGVLADREIRQKTADQFQRVYQTKVTGLKALLSALADQPLKVLVTFSSTTARLGRVGQSDYAMANEALNKLAQREAIRRPQCRVLSMNWGPWAGGMVTPGLRKLFAAEGVQLIPLRGGADAMVAELERKDGPVESLILGTGSQLPRDWQPASTPDDAPEEDAFSLDLNVEDYGFLRSHVIDGKAVLPMAMTAEWLTYAVLHVHPGLRFVGLADFRVTKGVVINSGSYRLHFAAGALHARGERFVSVATMRDTAGRLLARADVQLAERVPEAPSAPFAALKENNGIPSDAIYGQRLFHGNHFQCIESVQHLGEEGFDALVTATPAPREWMRKPLRGSWQLNPLGLDAAFQLMILWTQDQREGASLPTYLRSYHQYAKPSAAGVRIMGRVTAVQGQVVTADLAFVDRENDQVVALAEGYQCVVDPALSEAFARNQLPVKA